MAHGEKKRFSSPTIFFVKEESTLFFRMAKKASKQPIPTQLTFYKRRRVYERANVD